MRYDVRLKAIFQEAMPGLLRLLGLPAAVEYLTVEFPTRNKSLPDLVVRLVDGSILHIELQSKNDSQIVFRCLEYWLAIARQWPGARIHQVMIYLGNDPLTMQSSLDREELWYRFTTLNLQDIPASVFLDSGSDGEKTLAILCQTDDPVRTISQILGAWKHLPPKDLRERLESLTVLSQLKKRDTIVKEVVATMPIEIDITENAFYKDALARGEAKGRALGEARGVALGEARGEARGQAKGEAKLLSRILERRFGQLPEPIRYRIASADIDTLDHWADRLDVATTLDAIFSD
jgi:predicted transposase YdaD